MTIDFLPPDLGQFVSDELASGKYESEAEVFVAAVRLLQERERRVESLRRDIDAGMKQIASGQVIELQDTHSQQEFFDQIRRDAVEGLAKSRTAQ